MARLITINEITHGIDVHFWEELFVGKQPLDILRAFLLLYHQSENGPNMLLIEHLKLFHEKR